MSRLNLLANSRHGNGPLWGFVVAPGAKRHLLIVMTDQRPFAFGDLGPPASPGCEGQAPSRCVARLVTGHFGQ